MSSRMPEGVAAQDSNCQLRMEEPHLEGPKKTLLKLTEGEWGWGWGVVPSSSNFAVRTTKMDRSRINLGELLLNLF